MRLEGLWRDHDFVRLWSASTVSVFGTLITTTALPFTAILVLGASPSAVGWLHLAGLLPGILLALVAGALIDRRRRPVVVSALCLRGFRRPERDPGAERDPDAPAASLVADAAVGVRMVWMDRRLRALAAANLGLAVSFGTGGAAFLVYVNQVLGFGPGVLGLIFAIGGVTSFLGAIVAGRIAFLPIGPVMVACFVAAVIGTALAPLATSAGVVGAPLLVAQQFVSDPAWTILDINTVSLRQAVTADEALGRVNATFRVSDVGGQIVGTLVGGYVGDAFGARWALWIGVAALLTGAASLALSPVRNLRSLPAGDHVGAAA